MNQIKRRCACGCGGVTNYGNRWINNHHRRGAKFSKEHKKNLSIASIGNINCLGRQLSKETKLKISKSEEGKVVSLETRRKQSLAKQGILLSEEHKRKIALSNLKCNPNYEYCDAWKDEEYKDDLRKDYCENTDCKGIYKKLHNHHINLNKKDCRPFNIMTLCLSCHALLHSKLRLGKKGIIVNYKDFFIIIRKDHITYIHKETRKKITLKRKEKN